MLKKHLYIASDHAGFELKKALCAFFEEQKFDFDDLGTYDETSCDYPDYAHLLASKIDENSFGILICGSGIGMSIAANKHKYIRCALCNDLTAARLAREHNNANVLALGARFVSVDRAKEIIKEFLNTEFEGGRHTQRVQKIEEKKCC
ncbi:ribose 5-phosphate isomerase B [Campylobacter sp. MIT 12-8780]|uniref:ribose 5-phosphate isomerase B n=1 Tax=unclassified Campylobacter TaxID=2593542 RepID=UPI00115C9171|nr:MULTISPECIES: ribose 5-phosphate isomerase B [unclassified Campylobacter]NDJ28011.1 ribose 5-phosphate isomerase B [Campylobacter sp. MIT 19-121]TQR40502.1 ribose 5-phosphate isomerase B [Campylobacter sp. MIT 12-8780]